MADRKKLLKTLEELKDEEFKKFKWHLQQLGTSGGSTGIPSSSLEKADRLNTVDIIVQTYSHQSVEVVKKIFKEMNRNDLVEKLSNTSTRKHGTHVSSSGRGVSRTGSTKSTSCVTAGSHQARARPVPASTRSVSEAERPHCREVIPCLNDALSKYNDIISKSILMPSGSPVLYQLRPKKEKFGTLTRKTVGEKNLNKKNKTILLVGETGTGKSTLINTLFNYTMGVKFEDNIWFEIVEEEKKRNQSESQTSDVMVYEIFGFEDKTLPFSLTIIDTPGCRNTRGNEHDVITSQRLFDLFRSVDGVHELDAVGLVLKTTDNRLSDRQKYIFDSITSLFGKDLEENLVALMTYSDGLLPADALEALEAANIKCAKNQKNQPVYFLFNNRQTTPRTGDTKSALENVWRVTERGMYEFTDFLEKSKPQQLITTLEVINARIRITACIQNLQGKIQLIELKQNEIQQTKEALKKHEEAMKKNEEFTVEVDEAYKEKEHIRGGMWGLFFYKGAVTCTICEETCHFHGCTKAWYPEHCEVMEDGCCIVCKGKCPASKHVKEEWIYVNKTRKVKKKKWLDEIYHYVEQLERIALNEISLYTYVDIDFLIEKMKKEGKKERIQKLEFLKSRAVVHV